MNSKKSESSFENLFSLGDAAREWRIDESTLRKSISGGKFIIDKDVKKFGKQWIIKKESMEREYGLLKKPNAKRDYSANKLKQIYYFESECVYKYSKKHHQLISDSSRTFSQMNIWEYIYDCYDYLHLGSIDDVISDVSNRINRGLVYDG